MFTFIKKKESSQIINEKFKFIGYLKMIKNISLIRYKTNRIKINRI